MGLLNGNTTLYEKKANLVSARFQVKGPPDCIAVRPWIPLRIHLDATVRLAAQTDIRLPAARCQWPDGGSL